MNGIANAPSEAALAQFLGAARHVFDIDAAQRDGELFLGIGERRKHDLAQEFGALMRLFAAVDRRRGAQDVIGRDPLALAGEGVTAARTTNAFENAVAHQGLQHRLEVPRR